MILLVQSYLDSKYKTLNNSYQILFIFSFNISIVGPLIVSHIEYIPDYVCHATMCYQYSNIEIMTVDIPQSIATIIMSNSWQNSMLVKNRARSSRDITRTFSPIPKEFFWETKHVSNEPSHFFMLSKTVCSWCH